MSKHTDCFQISKKFFHGNYFPPIGFFIFIFFVFWSLTGFALNSSQKIEKIIENMPLEKQVGQLFVFGFIGSDFKHSLEKKMNTLYPGTIIVFGRNVKTLNQIRQLNFKAQQTALKNSKIPLLIAIDQEGGKVIRIKTSPSLPSARTLALTNNHALVQEVGYVTGRFMTTLGFNMNLAPVVDISDTDYTDFLGNRSFSNKKEIVNEMSTAFSRGLVNAGVLPTAKHFPGHGGVKTDSHISTPYKQITLTELLFNDLEPYKEMQNHRIPFAIMASHISYPLIDPLKRPASFSPLILKNVLRKGLGFEGILLTDDIQMGGAKFIQSSIGDRAVKAILAGNDLIMVGWNYRDQKKAIQSVIQAIQKGQISRKRIKKSLRRILSYKMQFYKKPNYKSLKKQIHKIPLKRIYDKVFHEIFKKQVAKINLRGKKMDVYSYSRRFLMNYKKRPGTRLFHLKNFRNWNENSSENSNVIYHLSGPITKKILKTVPLNIKKKMIVINSSNHIFIENESDYKNVIHIHSHHPKLGRLTAHYLSFQKQNSNLRKPASKN